MDNINSIIDIFTRIYSFKMVENESKIWFPWYVQNGLCELNKHSKEVKILTTFDKEPLEKSGLYCSIEKVNNFLVLVPGRAKNIAVYDLLTGDISYVPIKTIPDLEIEENDMRFYFWKSVVYDSKVYMLGACYPSIIKFDPCSKEIKYLTDWVAAAKEYGIKKTEDYFADGIIVEDTAWMPFTFTNAVLKMHMKTEEWSIVKLNTLHQGFCGITFNGEQFILVGRGKGSESVVYWDGEKKTSVVTVLEKRDKYCMDPFYAPICIQDKTYLFPILAEDVYEIDLKVGKVRICEEMEFLKNQNYKFPVSVYYTINPHVKDGLIYFISGKDGIWHKYDPRDRRCMDYQVRLSKEEIEKRCYEIFWKRTKEIFFEFDFPLNYFIKSAVKHKDTDRIWKNDNGKMIWDSVSGN